MSEGSGFKGESESSTQVDIPDFLRPLLSNLTGAANSALFGVQRAGRDPMVAGFTEDQRAAMEIARQRAYGEGGYIPTTQEQLLRTAEGVPLDSYLPASAFNTLSGGGEYLPAEVLDIVRGLPGLPGSTVDTLTQAQNAGAPAGLDRVISLASDPAGAVIPDSARAALERTASGDFLYGGEGFDQAVDAALRRVTPGVLSTFGSAGAGGATGGLARTAIAQAGLDAFASQYGDERSRQLSAAQALADLETSASLTGRGQSLDALLGAAGVDLGGRELGINAAGLLGDLGLARSGLDLQAGGLLADAYNADANRDVTGAGILADLSNAERNRQVGALDRLPQAGLLDVDLLSQIGQQQQDLNQRLAEAPFQQQLQILMAALGGLPISSLLGSTTEQEQRGFSLGFSD